MFDLNRNVLGQSASPYLRQHQDNPVHWQEWGKDLLDEAVRLKRPLFVSVGYATCHWCHVMAAKVFSDAKTARLLNEHFICVKIDRELRPDIDHFLMQYLVTRTGQGGWPLNVFLTPEQVPVYAFTYADSAMMAEIARQVQAFMATHADTVTGGFDPQPEEPLPAAETELADGLLAWSDRQLGGFGRGQKFPPHTAMLFLLYHQATRPNDDVRDICRQTLDAMQLRGLNDHLQGGIFRYCVDRAWTTPHFEKMLYDQAMALWTYALAACVLGRESYRVMAFEIVRCLDESFASDAYHPGTLPGDTLYVTAHDADTDHQEGAVYLWSWDELRRALTPAEFDRFAAEYEISPEGNFEGKNHLIRRRDALREESLRESVNANPAAAFGNGFSREKSERPDENTLAVIEAKLLQLRRRRPQPQCDDKLLCDLNALTAVALIQAGRLLARPDLEARAVRLVRRLLGAFKVDGRVRHALAGGHLLEEGFLADAAALMLAVTMLAETDPGWLAESATLEPIVRAFNRDGVWLEALADDFHPVAASWFDHPIPASVSLAEMALVRNAWLQGGEPEPLEYRTPYQADFYNVAAMLTQGRFHQITRPQPLPWSELPPNAIQRRGEPASDCYGGVCTPIK